MVNTLFPLTPLALAAKKCFSYIPRAQRCYEEAQVPVPSGDTLGCGPPCTGTDLVNRKERGAAVSQASFPALKAGSFQRQFT